MRAPFRCVGENLIKPLAMLLPACTVVRADLGTGGIWRRMGTVLRRRAVTARL